MKPQVKNLLDFLCKSTWERQIAEEFMSGVVESEAFWVRIRGLHPTCCGFDSYYAIARCHVLCVASAPESSDIWLTVVAADLRQRARNRVSFDGYEMGTLLGLFQAGKWLQDHTKGSFGIPFLPTMAKYCFDCLNRRFEVVNPPSAANYLDHARNDLDRAVKDYLRPQNEEVIKSLRVDIQRTLAELRDNWGAELEYLPPPASWLLSALLLGVLNIEKRKPYELITAALALVS